MTKNEKKKTKKSNTVAEAKLQTLASFGKGQEENCLHMHRVSE